MRVFGLAGWSGSGKTTLMVGLLPEFVRRGIRVSTIKHAHHEFDVDKPGKDSYRHRDAGATEVMIGSAKRWALMHELRADPEPSLASLIERMSPVDLIMVEGFKANQHPKLEIHRPSVGKPLLCPGDRHIVAVASDADVPGLTLPRLPLDDVTAIASFILDHVGLTRRPPLDRGA